MDQFRRKASSFTKKVNADRAEVDQDRAAIESERETLAKERREVEKLRARLEVQQAGVDRMVKSISAVVRRFAEYLGLPLPKMLGAAITALEHEIEIRIQELEPEDPNRLAADDPASSFSM